MKIIGFEGGGWSPDAVVAWGAAAVEREDGSVLNAVTGYVTDRASFERLALEDQVTKVPATITLTDQVWRGGDRLVMVGVRRNVEGNGYFDNDCPRVTKRGVRNYLYIALTYPDQFDAYADRVVWDITRAALLASTASEIATATRLARTALALKPRDPLLHAVRVAIASAESRPKLLRTAEASLPPGTGYPEFEGYLNALEGENLTYSIKYHGGIAAGKGMNVDDTIRQLRAIDSVHEYFAEQIAETRPGLEVIDIPPPRLRQLEAASAKMVFAVDVEGETRLTRLARYLELRMLEDAVSGKRDGGLAADPRLSQAIDRIVRPSPDTIVLQTRLGSPTEEEVEAPIQSEAEEMRPGPEFRLLMFLQGALRELSTVELKVFPRLRWHVSMRDDGTGTPPMGSGQIGTNPNILFQLGVVAVNHYSTRTGSRSRPYARAIRLLESSGEEWFDTIPSSFFPGVLARVGKISLSREGGTVLLDGQPVLHGLGDRRHSNVTLWLAEYADWCAERELRAAYSESAEWFRVPRDVKTPSLLVLIIRGLDRLGGTTSVDALCNWLWEVEGRRVRRYKVRQTVSSEPRYAVLESDDDGNLTVSLTVDGQRVAAIDHRVHGLLE